MPDPKLYQIRQKLFADGGRILVIQTAFLGDVILLTPLMRAVRKAFLKSWISVVVIPECAGVLNGMADEIITFDKRERTGRKERWRQLVNRLRERMFDVALIPHRSVRSAITALKAEIPVRIGFRRGLGSLLHTHNVIYRTSEYEGKRNLRLIKVFSEVEDTGIPKLHPTSADRLIVNEYLNKLNLKTNNFVVIAPGSVWTSKRWSSEYFHETTYRLEKDYSLPVLAIGGSKDAETCGRVVSCPGNNLAGSLSPLGSAELISRARFLISGDTAPAHLGTSVGARQIIIFGSTSPVFGFAPPVPTVRVVQVPLWCRPCSDHGRNFCPKLGSYSCLKRVTPATVLEAAADWLNGGIDVVSI